MDVDRVARASAAATGFASADVMAPPARWRARRRRARSGGASERLSLFPGDQHLRAAVDLDASERERVGGDDRIDPERRLIQGDRVILDIMEKRGVKSEAKGNSLILTKGSHQQEVAWDFKHCPYLAQTVSVVCAAKGIRGSFTGLESLRIN